MDAYNRLPNLQLLEGPINQSKQDKLPQVWAETAFTNDESRIAYFDRHMLGTLPDSLEDFPRFYDDRRERIIERSKELVNFGVETVTENH